ncbi:MAG: hypothetical protein ACLFWM_03820 [Actinomycetota bacterium]
MLFERDAAARKRCRHTEVVTTVNFGLKRMVCLECGYVEMRNLPQEVVVRAEHRSAVGAAR